MCCKKLQNSFKGKCSYFFFLACHIFIAFPSCIGPCLILMTQEYISCRFVLPAVPIKSNYAADSDPHHIQHYMSYVGNKGLIKLAHFPKTFISKIWPFSFFLFSQLSIKHRISLLLPTAASSPQRFQILLSWVLHALGCLRYKRQFKNLWEHNTNRHIYLY